MSSSDYKHATHRLAALIQQARRNEAIAAKLFDIELDMLRATELSEFTDGLTEQVRDRFELDEVWFALTDIEDNRRILALLGEQGGLSERLLVGTVDFLRLTENSDAPVLSDNIRHLQQLIPRHLRTRIRSLALLPLQMEGRLVGALILGSGDAARYQPGMESFFLHQLAIKVSAGLTSIWAREQLRLLATRDPLTGLRNRRDLEAVLEQELGRSQRNEQPLALLFLDLDDFKTINDNWGHESGDACLVHVAQRMQSMMRREDSLFRFAGDEFIALLPGQTEERAEHIAERMKADLTSNPATAGDEPIAVSFSYGIACIRPEANKTADELLRLADQRLYDMKRRLAD
ncbi:GGDEF domain-containing protein [Marinobacter halodurans]|nr:sensor domain-containing diguanylate cyclase [Marinobacter halodurans]